MHCLLSLLKMFSGMFSNEWWLGHRWVQMIGDPVDHGFMEFWECQKEGLNWYRKNNREWLNRGFSGNWQSSFWYLLAQRGTSVTLYIDEEKVWDKIPLMGSLTQTLNRSRAHSQMWWMVHASSASLRYLLSETLLGVGAMLRQRKQ